MLNHQVRKKNEASMRGDPPSKKRNRRKFRIIGSRNIDAAICIIYPEIIKASIIEIRNIKNEIIKFLFGDEKINPSIINKIDLIEFLQGFRLIINEKRIVNIKQLDRYINNIVRAT